MAGHSKWANIKRRKAKVDAQRGKVFTKLGRELIVATRQGGPNPEGNLRLRLAIQRARGANMPAEHIQRAIRKAAGEGGGDDYEDFTYEGYGPGGVAILVEGTSDNRNRTLPEVRYLFSRNGGGLGEAGCVAWLFDRKGLIVVERAAPDLDEEALMLAALEGGAEDVRDEGDSFAVLTAPADLERVRAALAGHDLPIAHAELTRVPRSLVEVVGEDREQVERLIELLEDHDDVQNVYANCDLPG